MPAFFGRARRIRNPSSHLLALSAALLVALGSDATGQSTSPKSCDVIAQVKELPFGRVVEALLAKRLSSPFDAALHFDCLKTESFKTRTFVDGITGDAAPKRIDIRTQWRRVDDTIRSRTEATTDGQTFHSMSIGEQSWIGDGKGGWSPLPAASQGRDNPLSLLGAFPQETEGLVTAAGLAGFALIGALSYASLAEPVEKGQVNGVDATRWSVAPKKVVEYAAEQGANLPSDLGRSHADYWTGQGGTLLKMDVFVDGAAVGNDETSSAVLFEISDLGKKVTIEPPGQD